MSPAAEDASMCGSSDMEWTPKVGELMMSVQLAEMMISDLITHVNDQTKTTMEENWTFFQTSWFLCVRAKWHFVAECDYYTSQQRHKSFNSTHNKSECLKQSLIPMDGHFERLIKKNVRLDKLRCEDPK